MRCGAIFIGRVIETVRFLPARFILFSMLILFSLHSVKDITTHFTDNDSALLRSVAVQVGSKASLRMVRSPHSIKFADPHHADLDRTDLDRDVIVTTGSVVYTMDDDSFLGKINSRRFWKKKRKKKSSVSSGAQFKKQRAAKFDGATRSGLLTTKPPKGSFLNWFAGQQPLILPPKPVELANNVGTVGGGYRTLCVRLSDGYYWPISFATSRGQFLKDQRICKRSCAEAVKLYVYRNPKGRPEDMVDLKGQSYNKLENAWRYREEYVSDRKCSPHPWEEASLSKHKAYALMASRAGDRVQDAALSGQRRLVRVGQVRTMSTIDLDYVGNTKYRLESPPVRVGKVSTASTVAVEKIAPRKRVVQKSAVERRRQVRKPRGNARRMGLGATIRKGPKTRRVKRSSYRAKKKRRPRWASEALGLD